MPLPRASCSVGSILTLTRTFASLWMFVYIAHTIYVMHIHATIHATRKVYIHSPPLDFMVSSSPISFSPCCPRPKANTHWRPARAQRRSVGVCDAGCIVVSAATVLLAAIRPGCEDSFGCRHRCRMNGLVGLECILYLNPTMSAFV